MERLFVLMLALIGVGFGVYAHLTPTTQKAIDAYDAFAAAADDGDPSAIGERAASVLSLIERQSEAEPEDIVRLKIEIAEALLGAGAFDASSEYYARAIADAAAMEAPRPPLDDALFLADVLLRLAAAQQSAGDAGSAINTLGSAIEGATRDTPSELYADLPVLDALIETGAELAPRADETDNATAAAIGDFYVAAKAYTVALPYLEAALDGAGEENRSERLAALAAAQAGLGDAAAAILLQREAIDLAEAQGADARTLIPLYADLGRYHLAAGDVGDAVTVLRRAQDDLDFELANAPGDLSLAAMGGELFPLLADALRQSGDEAGATALEDQYQVFFVAAEDAVKLLDVTKGFRAEQEEWVDYTLLYGTTRKRSTKNSPSPASFYTNDKTTTGERGMVTVSVPKQHKIGEVEAPGWLKVFNRRDRRKYIVMDKPEPLSQEDFSELLRQMIEETAEKQAFIFIHGYNTSFHDAARKTAQLSHDLQLDAAPMFYSWPSRASLLGYGSDLNTWPSAREDMRNFIREAAEKSGAETVHIIAHSMGNKYLLDVLNELWLIYDEGGAIPADWALGEVIFAAPDVEADEFVKAMSYANRLSSRTTLYASKNDKALKLSRRVNKGRRAGDSRKGITTADLLTSIDASEAKTDFLGHGYFSSGESIITDIRALLSLGVAPERRCYLEKQQERVRPFWIFRKAPPQCSANAFDWAIYLILLYGGGENPSDLINAAADDLIADFEAEAGAAQDEEAAAEARQNAAMIKAAKDILRDYLL